MTVPWKTGDRVQIIRHEHGYVDDDCIVGIVTKREQRPTGSWKYVVRVGEGKDAYDQEILKTKDLRRA